jgi:hypothetical protein
MAKFPPGVVSVYLRLAVVKKRFFLSMSLRSLALTRNAFLTQLTSDTLVSGAATLDS